MRGVVLWLMQCVLVIFGLRLVGVAGIIPCAVAGLMIGFLNLRATGSTINGSRRGG